ncbi:MAG: hypothetical protein F6K42_13795 [Leptolyngbya sp. SIO1D8]|nr:hypothetical protein [Leptolyngbya sp. SIO1D8]
MTLSPLQKALLSSACTSGAVFTIATVPLAMYRSQPVEVQVQNQPVFASELNTLAGPYLGVTGAFSVALGAGILGMSGWRLAASKSESEQAKSSELERSLLAYKAELERIKFSDTRLKAQDLEAFLEQQPPSSTQPATTAVQHLHAVHSEPALVAQNQSFASLNNPMASEQKPLTAITDDPSVHTQIPALSKTKTAQHSVLELVMHQMQEPTAMAHKATSSNGEKLNHSSGNLSNHLEKASENQLELVLSQLHNLAEQVESLRANRSSQAAA